MRAFAVHLVHVSIYFSILDMFLVAKNIYSDARSCTIFYFYYDLICNTYLCGPHDEIVRGLETSLPEPVVIDCHKSRSAGATTSSSEVKVTSPANKSRSNGSLHDIVVHSLG